MVAGALGQRSLLVGVARGGDVGVGHDGQGDGAEEVRGHPGLAAATKR